jgi:hypothetical protein
MEMMKKDGGDGMDEASKKAKMDVLKELFNLASGSMGEHVKDGLQKVSVMAKDKEGLMKGLEKAKELAGGKDLSPAAASMKAMMEEPEEDEDDAEGLMEETPEHEAKESPEEEKAEGEMEEEMPEKDQAKKEEDLSDEEDMDGMSYEQMKKMKKGKKA